LHRWSGGLADQLFHCRIFDCSQIAFGAFANTGPGTGPKPVEKRVHKVFKQFRTFLGITPVSQEEKERQRLASIEAGTAKPAIILNHRLTK
jgi:hypothetical protein